MGYIKPKAVIMTMWRRGFLKHLEKGSMDRFLILVFLVNIQRIRGQVHDSCLSCEYSILWEGIEFIK